MRRAGRAPYVFGIRPAVRAHPALAPPALGLPLLGALLLATAGAGRAQPAEIHTEHVLYGLPTGTPPTNDLVIRDAYALSHNDSTRFADWVAFRLTAAEVAGTLPLARAWRADEWLGPDERIETADYAGAFAVHGYQRGHLAPLASFSGSLGAGDLNVLSNVVPQRQALNEGPWQRLEAAERVLVLRRAELTRAPVWVVVGTLYERAMPPLPEAHEPHVVPSGFWRVVAVEDGPGRAVAVAFLLDQDTPRDADVLDALVTVDEVERRRGLDLFPLLPLDGQAALEGRADRAEAAALLNLDD